MIFSDSYKRMMEHNNEIAMKHYRAGKPLFTRAMLKQFEGLVVGRETELTFLNYIGREYTVTAASLSDRCETCVTLIITIGSSHKKKI